MFFTLGLLGLSFAYLPLCWLILGPLGAILGPLGPSYDRLGALLGPLGALLGPLGAVLGPLGAVLEPLGALVEASWGHLRGPKTQSSVVAKMSQNTIRIAFWGPRGVQRRVKLGSNCDRKFELGR